MSPFRQTELHRWIPVASHCGKRILGHHVVSFRFQYFRRSLDPFRSFLTAGGLLQIDRWTRDGWPDGSGSFATGIGCVRRSVFPPIAAEERVLPTVSHAVSGRAMGHEGVDVNPCSHDYGPSPAISCPFPFHGKCMRQLASGLRYGERAPNLHNNAATTSAR